MPLMLGTKGNDILQWRASAELVATLKGSLSRKWARSSAPEAESFMESIIGSIEDELRYEAQFRTESAALDAAIDAAASPGELQPLLARYREVASAHFSRRRSVLALCEVCNKLHDRVLAKAVALAEERMLQMGQGPAPVHALFVSGDRGRGEQTLRSENRYLVLHEDDSPRFFLFSRQLSGALRETGLTSAEQIFWHGSLQQWRALLGESAAHPEAGAQWNLLAPLPPFAAPSKEEPRELPEWQERLEALTDLKFAGGDRALGREALDAAARAVAKERNRDPFLQLARRVIALPLAVGRFGRWRLHSSGEHRRELDLGELALRPLVLSIRVLAVHAGIHTGGTLDRIGALLEKGALDVDLADRLLKAYRCFMQLKIVSEIRSEESGFFRDPDELGEAESARLKSSVEAVLNLQKIAYQRLVLQG